LEACLVADTILEQGFVEPLRSRLHESNKRTQAALEAWEEDRSDVLFILLFLTQTSYEQGTVGSMAAQAECSLVLAKEPLIPSRDQAKYYEILSASDAVLTKAIIKERSEDIPLLEAFEAGILYNTERFCPHLFEEPVTENDIDFSFKFFLQSLDDLQGKF